MNDVNAKNVKKNVLVWAAGGLVVVPLDALHVTSGTIPFRQAGLEVAIPMFVVGAVVVGLLHRFLALPLATLWGASTPRAGARAALLTTLAFLGAYASSSFVGEHALLAVAAYGSAFAVVVACTPSAARPALLLMALGAGVLGPAFEGFFASTGAFRYARPDVFHVPMWLPGVYLLAGAAVSTVDRWLNGAATPSTAGTPLPARVRFTSRA